MTYVGKKPADIIATAVDTTTGTFSGDLTVDTNTLYVDSANNRVGIGTASSLVRDLNINGTAANSKAFVRFSHDGLASTGLDVGYSSAGYASIYNAENTAMVFSTNASEAMRIDSSGNLLVGKTAINSASSGVQIEASGTGVFGRSGSLALIANRNTNDGDIVSFRKDGTTVGSIGSNTGYLYIGSTVLTDAFIGLGNSYIYPSDSIGGYRDNAIDLGYSTSRFKDLYLSGGVYLGGTGSANYLDDYEEGTFTHSLTNFSGTIDGGFTTGSYTKIGNTVHVHGAIVYGSGTVTGTVELSGLPFVILNASRAFSIVSYNGNIATSTFGVSNIEPNRRASPNQSTLETGITSGTGACNLVYSATYTT